MNSEADLAKQEILYCATKIRDSWIRFAYDTAVALKTMNENLVYRRINSQNTMQNWQFRNTELLFRKEEMLGLILSLQKPRAAHLNMLKLQG